MNLPERFLVIDVESMGLHGQAFALGAVLITRQGDVLDEQLWACDPQQCPGSPENKRWVSQHVPTMDYNCATPIAVREQFWRYWRDEVQLAESRQLRLLLAADCAWPVEARFLAQCVDDDPKAREWQGPYPLIDIASLALARGEDPTETHIRLASEKPAHHPLHDARQSARLLVNYLNWLQPQ